MRRLVVSLAGPGRWSVFAAALVLPVGAGWGTPLRDASVFSLGELTLAELLATGGGPGDQLNAPGFAQQTKTYNGPFDGTLTATVLADGTFDRFRLKSSVEISNYGQGSFVDVYNITIPNWLPVASGAGLRVNDTVTHFGTADWPERADGATATGDRFSSNGFRGFFLP